MPTPRCRSSRATEDVLKFEALSDDAKLLFVIGEPLRYKVDLTSADWLSRTFTVWSQITGKNEDCFRAAFVQVTVWIESK